MEDTQTNFAPIPGIVGAYRKEHFGTEFAQLGPFSQAKWLHHQQQLEKVIEGDYNSIMPVTAEFIPTLDCCFRCPTCAYKKWKQDIGIWDSRTDHPEWSMDYDSMVLYLDKLRQGGVKALLFTGGGEPFYNPLTINGIEYACSLGFNVGIYTNGALLDEEKISRIFDAKASFIRISLNAGNAESHSRIHGYNKENYFEKIIENVYTTAQKRKDQGLKTNFEISVIVNPVNVDGLEQIACLMGEIHQKTGGIGHLNIRPTLNYYDGEQFPAEIFEKAMEELETKVRKITDNAGLKLFNLTHKFDDVLKPRTYKTCRASSFFGELGPDGTLYLCCEKLGYPEYAIGSLKEQTIEEIWKSEKRRKVIEKVKSEECSKCPPSCKPHQLNKIFDQIEALRRLNRMEVVLDWIKDLKEIKLRGYNFL